MATLPALPAKYKAVQHYVKIASDHIKRDPAIAYYCYFYAVQKALEIDKKAPECRTWLAAVMDVLEKLKTENKESNEAFQGDIVGHAYIEDYTLKLFLSADNKDRAGQFDKALVKSFYTSGLLFDVLQQFGELSDEMKTHQKYAKWKASYLHRCLQSGETPVAGPLPLEGETNEFGESDTDSNPVPPSNYQTPFSGQQSYPSTQPYQPPPSTSYHPPSTASGSYNATVYPSSGSAGFSAQSGPSVANTSVVTPYSIPPSNASFNSVGAAGNIHLRAEDYQRAIKLCKFAQSAMQYEDSTAAIDNLSKALRLLTTGKE